MSQTGELWTHEWTASIHDIKIHDSFIDDDRHHNHGTNVTITDTTVVKDCAWPQGAKDIVADAGIRAPHRDTVMPNGQLVNDGELGSLPAPATITCTGNWDVSRDRPHADVNGDVHDPRTDGDAASITFTGTGIQVLGERNSDQGTFSVTLDGKAAGTVDTKATSRVSQAVIYEVAGLPYGQHTVKLTKEGGEVATVDAFRLDRSIDEQDPAVDYDGDWRTYTNRGHGDLDDVRATTVNGASVTVPFVGTHIDVRSETNSDQGLVDVYVDGRYRTTVDTHASSRSAQKSVFSAELPDGNQPLRLVKKSGQYLVVDRITIR